MTAHTSGIVRVPLRIAPSASPPASRSLEPVTFGVPCAPGALQGHESVWLSQDGASVPAQIEALDRWADGSVRWLLVHTSISTPSHHLELVCAPSNATRTAGPAPISLSQDGARCTARVGALELAVDGDGGFPLSSVGRHGEQLLLPGDTRLSVVEIGGKPWATTWRSPVIVRSGPLRADIIVGGEARDGERRLDIELGITLRAGSEAVGLRLTTLNPAAARHPGGMWDLGDARSVQLRELSLHLRLPSRADEVSVRPEPGAEWVAAPELQLLQASSGGEHWNSSNHMNRDHEVALDFKGYKIHSTSPSTGLRATPILKVRGSRYRWAIAARYFWQVFPKALEVRDSEVVVSICPEACAEPQELQPGERMSWDFTIAFGDDSIGDVPLAWVVEPTLVSASPTYYASTGAVPYLTPDADDPHAAYLMLVRQAVDGPSAFAIKREVIDEYGWRHFGDVYGDHEAVYHTGPAPLVSHWNNQYDAIAGGFWQLMRSGDTRWFTLATELAAHVADIDIYHTTDDKSAYNGGLFWHTCHYVDADTATHRTYPSRGNVSGGGPSCGHLYTTGLMYAYFFTGERRFRDAAIGLADYVINCDDGRQTIFRWLDSGPTGHATVSGVIPYHGPGRAPANALNALIDAHRLTGEERYLTKATEILHRCIHPLDDVAAWDLLDAENKWFYTMFLQSIGKLLDHLQELKAFDALYVYARGSLLQYARWMATHERPFLAHPERLEFPTETWAAQDMRKAEVFHYAAKYAEPPERDRFFERATFFFNYSVETLATFDTRGLCRPVVLLMTNGWTRRWFMQNLKTLPPPHDGLSTELTPKAAFVPQKTRAIAKLKRLTAAAAAVVVVAVVLVVAALL